MQTDFLECSETQRLEKWKWGRNSDEVKKARQLEQDFLETIHAAKILALKKREEMKQKKMHRSISLLEKCKHHGGPVTPESISRLHQMTQKELLTEIGYIRATISPDIREKRRIKLDNGRFKFQTFSNPELIRSITDVIKLENRVENNVESLLRLAFVV